MKTDIVTGLLIQMVNLHGISLDKAYNILLETGFLDKIPENAKDDDFIYYLKKVEELLL